MALPKLKVKAAWRENLLRNLKGGRGLTETTRLLRVGKSKLYQEFRRDPEFHREVEQLTGSRIDASRSGRLVW